MRPRLDKHHVAVVVGMDGEVCLLTQNVLAFNVIWKECVFRRVFPGLHVGFHYTRAQLDEFPDPDEAHARRGAYWTFDGMAFVRKMQDICAEGLRLLHFAYFLLVHSQVE